MRTTTVIPPDGRESLTALKLIAWIAIPFVKRGKLLGALCIGQNEPRQWTAEDVELLQETAERIWAAVERGQVEIAIAESEKRLKHAADAARLTYVMVDFLRNRWLAAPNFSHVSGFSLGMGDGGAPLEMARTNFLSHVAEDDRARVSAILQHETSETLPDSLEYRLRGDDGSERWMECRPLRENGAGKQSRLFIIVLDITERKKHEEHVTLLMGEVNHRSKNLLAVVQSMARQTARDTTASDFIEHFCQRLQGLAASQTAIVAGNWTGVSIEGLIRSQLSHLGGNLLETRIELSGSHVEIQPAAAQGIGMAIHELSTNAIKYGALSNDAGKISISWQCEANRDGKLRIMWSEKDGPTVLAPDHRGFGFTVIERMTAIATGGKVDLSYDSAGLRWVLEAPSANVIATSEGRHISG